MFQKYAERFHRMFALAAMLMIFHVRNAWYMLIKYRYFNTNCCCDVLSMTSADVCMRFAHAFRELQSSQTLKQYHVVSEGKALTEHFKYEYILI